jgi:hypothetical protein
MGRTTIPLLFLESFLSPLFLYMGERGVKQGGLLSVELYKLCIEDLLKTYENSKLGCRIGTLTINAITCANDIALVCDNPYDLQCLGEVHQLFPSRWLYA